jgi:hypothetical protein
MNNNITFILTKRKTKLNYEVLKKTGTFKFLFHISYLPTGSTRVAISPVSWLCHVTSVGTSHKVLLVPPIKLYGGMVLPETIEGTSHGPNIRPWYFLWTKYN